MKKHSRNLLAALTAVSFMFGFVGATPALAATTPSLGTAGTYAVLSSTFTRNIGLTTIVLGDLGYTTLGGSGTHSVVAGSIFTPPPAQAGLDQAAALVVLNAQACTFNFPAGPIDLSTDLAFGGVYPPGVYCSTGAMNIGGPLTISGSGTHIFRPTGAFTSTSGSIVSLSGTSVCDLFWTPGLATTLGANTTFFGTVIDNSGITVGNTSAWTGRALASGGTVVMDTVTITAPSGCSASPAAGGLSNNNNRGLGNSVTPLIGILKVPSPLALPAGPGPVTYNYTVWNVGGVHSMNNVTVVDDKCSPVVLQSGDLNGDHLLDPGENWKYACSMVLATTTTNSAIAVGYGNDIDHQTAIDTALSTVVVGSAVTAPLINVVKVPSTLIPLPFGGGNVTYTYTVTNPGVIAMHDVAISDDKCYPINRISGDMNGDNLLDPSESWVYTCSSHLSVSTTNGVTVQGTANGFTAHDYAVATVFVGTPGLPNTGFPPRNTAIPQAVLIFALAVLGLVITKREAMFKD